ncbi:heavy metal translocating P-type ATPase [Aquimarina sp. 2201CG5-10]|uniref:heavy metal translocating P-type ATPase n=1 Tax=Aquimarina callyspongiae TaxID=3098150 RepID=UPI002AB59118|nr:MauE/DoxX family redox-associated membrane protein [Aquimarina sp. 2201CG5-10]MDY8134720.1 cation transporter [Aquimarina sp. 2201CG5-10]
MIQTYQIDGMTCNGCRSQVMKKLNEIKDVISVDVDLQNKEAVIKTKSQIQLEVFQKALPDKYIISKKEIKEVFLTKTEEKGELQQLFPLFLIFGYITIAAVGLNVAPWSTEGFMLDFMGLFYVVFSFFKLLDLKGFPDSFKMYDPLAKLLPFYGWVYPFIEVTLGIFFLTRFQIEASLIITLIVLGATTIGVTKVLLDKKSIRCACLGTALKLPMTKATFIENSIMLIMTIWMLIKIYS